MREIQQGQTKENQDGRKGMNGAEAFFYRRRIRGHWSRLIPRIIGPVPDLRSERPARREVVLKNHQNKQEILN